MPAAAGAGATPSGHPVSWSNAPQSSPQAPPPQAPPPAHASPRQANPQAPTYQQPQFHTPPPFQTANQTRAPRTSPSGTDAKPLVPRTDDGIINRAEEARDRIFVWLEAYCRRKGIEPSILKSPPYNPSIWVECRAWSPTDPSRMCTDRSLFLVNIRTAPFHQYEILYDVTVSVGEFSKRHTSVCELNQSDVDRMMDVLLTGNLSQIKRARLRRLRTFPWQFWRPKNKVTALDSTFMDLPTALSYLALGCLVLAGAIPFTILLAIVLFAIVVGINVARSRRRWSFRNQGKPLQEPRNLHRLDSWQTLIFEIGKEVGPVRQEVLAELRKGANSGFVVETETIWYWGVDGKEEREQLVARFRRGIAFIQIYAYGQDLFVGWDANINAGTWVEREVARGLKSGQMFSLRTVEAGRQDYSEYDLFDTNCLVEWVHGSVVKVVKRKMAHHSIDQEIDFKIIRGDRPRPAPSVGSAAPAASSKVRKLFSRVE